MTRNLAVPQAAHYMDFANGNKSGHNPWQWNLGKVPCQFLWALLLCITHYIGKVPTLSFQHCVTDIGNLSKWAECHLLAEEVGHWKSSSKVLNIGSCVTHARMIYIFNSFNTLLYNTCKWSFSLHKKIVKTTSAEPDTNFTYSLSRCS